MSGHTVVGVGLIGPGLIGRTLLKQIANQAGSLKEHFGLRVQVVGITNSRKMLLSPASGHIDLTSWEEDFERKSEPANLDQFFSHMTQFQDQHHVMIDNTASDLVPAHYEKWLSSGCHVVTPNKKAGSGNVGRYNAIRSACRTTGSHFFYESTVGAGLPVISSLQGLLNTGDQVQRIEGVFSGTLSYIFNNLSKDNSFSKVVAEAKAKGFTEPDPREDLAGMDVARKVIVLARECGVKIEMEELPVESLVPEELQQVDSVDAFMERLSEFDESILSKIKDAESSGEVLRYVGVVDVANKQCEVALKRYPKTHPLAGLNGTDNLISFTTDRYSPQPLVIQGPGAGADVTAMGVFSDFIALSRLLGPKN